MQIVLSDCFVSSISEGVGKDSGRPYMRVDFLDMGSTRHEYSVFVPERGWTLMRSAPTDGTSVYLYFDLSRGRNMSLQLDLVGWSYPSEDAVL